MTWEEIEQRVVDAGWRIDGGFSEHLVIGEGDDLSILAHKRAWRIDDPMFELADRARDVTY